MEHMLRIDNEKADFCTSIAMSMPLSGIKLSRTYMDFEGLLGNYYLYIQGDAIKNESNYYINSKWQVYDYYDFDTYEQVEQYLKEEEKIEQIEEIIGTAVAELHYAGLARFYYITGSIDAFNGMVE